MIVDRLSRYLDGEEPRPALAMFGLNAVDELDNATFIWLAPVIAESFHKDVGAFGVISILVLVVAPIIAIPVSMAADRRPRMPIALACAGLWGLFSFLSGLSVVLWMLVVARVGASLGRTVSYPVQLSLMSDFYTPHVRAKALGVHAVANHVGSIFGALAAGAIAAAFDWRAAFFVLTIPTMLVIFWSRKVQEPKRGAYERLESETPPPLRTVFPRLYAIRSLRYLWFASIWFVGGLLGAQATLAFYFKEEFGIEEFGLGVIGAVAGLGSIVATFVGARMAQERLNQSPQTGVRWLASIAFVVTGLLAAFAVGRQLWIAVTILFVISALFGLVAPLLATIGTMVSPPELRSSAYSIGQVISLAGAVFGLLISAVAQEGGYTWAYGIAAFLFFVGASQVVTSSRFANADVERLDPDHVDEVARTDASGRKVLLETKGLTVSYGGVQVLFGVDIVVREGECVALLGTNGAGKSTVLNAVSGLVEPDGGNVWFDGLAITGETPERTAARGLIQAPGGRGIFPGLTVEENLRLGTFLIRGSKQVAAQRVEAALDAFPKLRGLLQQRAGSLSGGERQMLVLAQAFLLKPRLLLIDELSLGLAPVVVQDLLVAVRRLQAEGVTIVVVEQSVNVALTLADRAYFLEKGEVRFEGPAAELLERNDLLRSVFFGGAGEHVGDLV